MGDNGSTNQEEQLATAGDERVAELDNRKMKLLHFPGEDEND